MIYAVFTEETLKEFLKDKVIEDIQIDKSVRNHVWIKVKFKGNKFLDLRAKLDELLIGEDNQNAQQA